MVFEVWVDHGPLICIVRLEIFAGQFGVHAIRACKVATGANLADDGLLAQDDVIRLQLVVCVVKDSSAQFLVDPLDLNTQVSGAVTKVLLYNRQKQARSRVVSLMQFLCCPESPHTYQCN